MLQSSVHEALIESISHPLTIPHSLDLATSIRIAQLQQYHMQASVHAACKRSVTGQTLCIPMLPALCSEICELDCSTPAATDHGMYCVRQITQTILTLKVEESLGLNLSWDVQGASRHATDGSHVSELPVSKHPVNCLGGVPSWNSP